MTEEKVLNKGIEGEITDKELEQVAGGGLGDVVKKVAEVASEFIPGGEVIKGVAKGVLGGDSEKSKSTGGTSSSGSVITQSGNATGGGKNIGIVGNVSSEGNVNIG